MEPRSSDEAVRREIWSFIEPVPPLVHHPFMRQRPEKGMKLFENFKEVSGIEEPEPELVQVYLRMKPCKVPNNLYELRSDKCLIASLDTTTAGHGRRTQHNVSKMYTFSRIFKAETSQKEVFDEVVKDNLKRLIDGHSFTLLTYGASGSGKTYTVMGTVNSPGLVPRALEYLFKLVDAAQIPIFKPSENGTDELSCEQQGSELQWVKRLLHVSVPFRDKYRRMSAQLHSDLTVSSIDLTNRIKYYVWVSFVEIYNEAIYDLLAPPDKRAKLRLREDSAGNVYVKDVTQAFVRSGEEAYDVMVAGKHNLVVAATGIHARSSRSHCIFTITMLTEQDGKIRTSHVRLCDLAGSERQRAARNTGVRMTESRAINSSLHVLERCLHMLRRKQLTRDTTMVPYRECKLTRLLGSGLSGARGEAVSMVVTVNPAPQYAHETRHVLALAVVAKDIQINNTIDPMATTMNSLECTQDSTMQDYTDEILRLRTENERLHFELVQAQSCQAQLRRAMEEKRQESASAMLEVIEETKEMMRVFYEEQLTRLRSQMQEMEDDYESKLAEMTKKMKEMEHESENKLTEMTKKQKSKLSEQKSARESEEDEMQNVRERIEERDANEYEEKESRNPDSVYSTDSDNESDSDTDRLDESLEPVNQLRKSILHKETLQKYEGTIDLINESLEKESENDDSENYMNNDDSLYGRVKPKDSVEAKESLPDNDVAISKDSLYATGDEYVNESENSEKYINEKEDQHENEIDNQSKQIENAIDPTADLTRHVNKINNKDAIAIETTVDKYGTFEIETNKNDANDNAEQDKSECEELFNVSTKLDETRDVGKDTIPTNLRGTYFVRNEPQTKCDEDLKLKTLNVMRGTDFEEHREVSFYKETNIEHCNDKKKLSVVKNQEPVRNKESPTKSEKSPTKFVNPKTVAETFVSKIIKSFKPRQSSAGSLSQFEQLEQAVNKANSNAKDNSTEAVKSFEITIPRSILKGKRYFDDAKEITDSTEIDKHDKYQNKDVKNNVKQMKYFEDKPDYSCPYQLSSAAKIQEKRLLFDSPEALSTSPDKQNKSNTETLQNLILTPKIVKEAQLYYTENDKVIHNDVLISRSPSVIRDDLSQDYEPSVAIKKILGESFTKPEIVSSARKDRLASRKHESVDIFESPLPIFTNTNSKVDANIEKTADKNAEQAKNSNNVEITSIANLNGKEIAHEFVEHLIASQKIKAYVKKEEFESAKSFDTKESTENKNLENTQIFAKEIKQEKLSLTTFVTEQSTIDSNVHIKSEVIDNINLANQLNETQSTKENNTIDEFENIVKDLTNMRATEFELLVAEEDNQLPHKPTQDQDTAGNLKENEITEQLKKFEDKTNDANTAANLKERETTERTKKMEEAKYNLRNKGKTNANISDDNKNIEPEAAGSRTSKRCLRLRRRKNIDENTDQENEKLKDIVNLGKEFCDVIMGLPAEKKEVKDIPSPEKLPGEEENVPPMMGIQSCPSKSVTRSRRKLFTPRAEPLEESPGAAGDSNERVYVPRPSYHRARARRRL